MKKDKYDIGLDPTEVKWAPAKAVNAADHLIRLKKTKDPWTVIEEIVKVWKSTNPTEYDSFLYTLDWEKADGKIIQAGGGKRATHASIDTKGTGGILRHTLDIPVKVNYMIRALYPPEELPMDKAFYDKWARKFPKMVISEVV